MKYTFLFLGFGLVLFFSCQEEGAGIEKLKPINPQVNAEIIRFEQLLQDNDLIKAKAIAPNFYNLYFQEILGLRDTTDYAVVNEEITQDSGFQNLYEEVQINYSDLGAIRAEINQALENYLEVFQIPKSALPNVYTFISGFVYQTLVFEDQNQEGVAVALEMFLGDQFPYKSAMPNNPSFSDYLTRSYNSDHLVKKVIEVLVEDKIPPPSKGDFLSLIIWGGKKLYIMDQILDFKPDTVVTEYTEAQLAWCQNNQAEMWDLFFEKDLFYSTDFRSFNKLIAPAPTSPGMPPESPGRTGNYMGWQVVKSYMYRYPETTIPDLIRITDAQQLLDDSKFKPGR